MSTTPHIILIHVVDQRELVPSIVTANNLVFVAKWSRSELISDPDTCHLCLGSVVGLSISCGVCGVTGWFVGPLSLSKAKVKVASMTLIVDESLLNL